MKHYRVIIAPNAAQDIREAFEWFRIENPAYAKTWRDGLRTAITALETLPFKNPVAPESKEFDVKIRQLLYGRGTPWRIFYSVNDQQVSILHIRHGRQDYWRPTDTDT
ncbi:type II toxin-antitoxin system RelE/ParE family toxin [Thalassospira sp. ER-Se-21-Dark]|uniref:type II toxin-antitoxin system RelE/ParE family toxin n=1 Tax=Thalassospira sp. ER-Se-21-Dark TaxID=2585190 RepID=UPI001FF0BD15|nr:type II toxin-antitoxin system RelE/ParE family toxin [Thalassospira sp. ER-Se-21-Dark]